MEGRKEGRRLDFKYTKHIYFLKIKQFYRDSIHMLSFPLKYQFNSISRVTELCNHHHNQL